MERLKRKEEEQAKKERKRLRKAKSINGRKRLKKRAEALIHRYIRYRAADFNGTVQCYSCRKRIPVEDSEAGHRHHGKLDLDERNLKPQCTHCNHYLSGNLGEYERHLIEDYGLEWARKLKEDADKDSGLKTYEELTAIIEKYQELLNTL